MNCTYTDYPIISKTNTTIESLTEKVQRGSQATDFFLNKQITLEERDKIVSDAMLAREKIILCNMRLVINIAKRYMGPGRTIRDLVNDGCLGLIKAVERFDIKCGSFSTYASWWIHQTIKASIANDKKPVVLPDFMIQLLSRFVHAKTKLGQRLGRQPSVEEMSEQLDLKIEKVEELFRLSELGTEYDRSHFEDAIDSKNMQPFEELIKQQNNNILDKIQCLSDRERTIVVGYFGLGDEEAKNLSELGRMPTINLTRERVRQILNAALNTLRKSLELDQETNRQMATATCC